MNTIQMFRTERYCLPDDITPYDIVSAMFIGLVGSVISTNRKLELFLNEIHTDASLNSPKKLFGKLLSHKGDMIDTVFRGGRPFCTYLHRLYGRHDIFSFWLWGVRHSGL